MLRAIVEFSLRFKGVVVVLACALVGYGLWVSNHAKLEVFPDFVPPQATIQTEAPGFPPEDVERCVTKPIEDALNGLNALESLSSESIQGLSVVRVMFKEGTDLVQARQSINEQLSGLSSLPAGVEKPAMEPLTSATMDLLKFGITSHKKSAMELRTFADWVLKPRLLAAKGVAKVTVFGGDQRQYQIQLDPLKLQAYDLTMEDVAKAAQAAIGIRGAGFIDTENQRILIQTALPAMTTDLLGSASIDAGTDHTLRLRDVARVREEAAFKVGDAVIGGKPPEKKPGAKAATTEPAEEEEEESTEATIEPGVLICLVSQHGANTMDATLAVENVLNEMKATFAAEEITYHPGLHRPADFIYSSTHHVMMSLLLGGVFVTIVVVLFLLNLRTAFITLTAIPASLLTAVIVMDRFGFTLNTITLGGLAIAIGAVVDDAIIDVENIFRRLRENQLLAKKRSLLHVVLDASMEVRSAVVYATFVVVLVFVPVLTMSGLQGSFFAPLAWSCIIANLASLGMALTLTPALCLLFFRGKLAKAHEPKLQGLLKAGFRRLLAPLMGHAGDLIGAVAVVCLVVLACVPFMSEEFLPDFREGHFICGFAAAPGTTLEETRRIGTLIGAEMLKIPEITTVEQQIGRAALGDDTWGPEQCEYHINLREDVPGKRQAEIQKELEAILNRVPGLAGIECTTFLGDRIRESISGERQPVIVNIYGDDLDELDEAAKTISETLAGLKAGEPTMTTPPKTPLVRVVPRDDRLIQFNFKRMDIFDTIQTAHQGQTVGQSFEGNQIVDVVMLLDPSRRRDPSQIRNLLVTNSQGLRMPLHELANVFEDLGRSSISHKGSQRCQTVTVDPEGMSPAEYTAKAQAAVEKIREGLPEGIDLEWTGDAAAAAAARNQLALNTAIAGVVILILLAVVFGNWRNLMLLLVNLPFGLIGGIPAVILTTHTTEPFSLGTLSMGALFGFVTLFGLATRNSILLISHYEHLVAKEGMTWGKEAAIRGASERLVPILMTALVTALGLFPLALGTGEAGREIEGPMAVVILGGLVTSTLLNLLVMPTLALRFGRFAKSENGALPEEVPAPALAESHA
jgi:CzcA family heavy metal efflux pump